MRVGIVVRRAGSPDIPTQEALLAPTCDYLINVDTPTVPRIVTILANAGHQLSAGDTIALYGAGAFTSPMAMLIKFISDAHKRSVSVLLADRSLSLQPGALSPDLAAFLAALLDHNRAQVAERLAQAAQRGQPSGKPRKLSEAQIAQLKAELAKAKPNIAALARSMGVARVTLYRQLQRLRDAARGDT